MSYKVALKALVLYLLWHGGAIAAPVLEWVSVKDAPFSAAGDGDADDTQALQAAIDSVAKNAVIVFPPGEYLHDTLYVANKENITLLGRGAVSVGESFGANNALEIEASKGIKVIGFKWDRSASSEAQNNSAIVLFGCIECEVSQNEFYDVRYGVSVYDDFGPGNAPSQRTLIRGNTMSSRVPVNLSNATGGVLPSWLALVSDASEDTIVSENRVFGGRLTISQPGTQRTVVSNNVAVNTENTAVYFSGCSGCVATGNNIYEAGKDGIKAVNSSVDIVIANNRIAGAGALITNSPSLVLVANSSNVVISGNQLAQTENAALGQTGITINSSSDVLVNGNSISSTATTGNTKHGIVVKDVGSSGNTVSARISIASNRIYRVRGYGVWVHAASVSAGVEDLVIAGNHIVGTSGITNHCISVTPTSGSSFVRHVRISDNICDTFKDGGITLGGSGNSSYIHVSGNRIINADAVSDEAVYVFDGNFSGENIIENNTSDLSVRQASAPYNGFFFFQDYADEQRFVMRGNRLEGYPVDVTTNEDAAGIRTESLPSAEVGMEYVFVRVASFALRIKPSGSDTIGSGGAGKYLELQSNGSRVHLKSYVPGAWVIESSSGVVAYEQ